MKKIFILVVLFALVFQPALYLSKPGAAQETQGLVMASPLAQDSNDNSGMPGWPLPDRPIPHHEPGQPARSANASYQATRINTQGLPESVELRGLDALLADGTMTDPLQGNYSLVNLDKFMFADYNLDEDPDNFSVSSYAWDGTDLNEIPGSEQSFGDFWINAIAAGDLNRDYVDEQIAAWVNQDSQIEVSIRNLEGSVNAITSLPGVIAHPDGTLDILGRGYDYALWRLRYDGSWGAWENEAGGLLISAPAVTSRASGELDIFAIGMDNQVYQAHATPSSFSAWSLIDGSDIWDASQQVELSLGMPAPAVTAYNGKLALFRLAPDQTLRWSQSTDGVTWSAWEEKGGLLTSAPAAVSLQDGRIQVYALGMDGALWYRTFTYPATWGAWKHLETPDGVAQGAVPVLTSPSAGQVSVYLAGTENLIWMNNYNGTAWTGWSSSDVDGALGLGIGAANGPSGSYLVALLEDGNLMLKQNESAWAPLPILPSTPPVTLLDDATTKAPALPTTELENSILGMSTGYFTGDGRQQIILAYDGSDDNLRLEIYDIHDGFHLQKIAELTTTIVGGTPGVAAGDVNGDGVDEIGLVYTSDGFNCYLKVFQLSESTSTPTPYILEQIAEDHWWVYLYDQFYYFAGSLRIAAGDLVPENSPNDEFVILSDFYGYGDRVLAYLRVYDNDPDTIHLFFSNWYEVDMDGQVVTSIFYTGFDVAVGNVDGSGLDEIVFTYPHSDSDDNPFPEITRSLYIFACNQTACTQKAVRMVPDESAFTFLDRLEVADLDEDLKDEIVLARTSGSISLGHVALDIYEYETSINMLYGYVTNNDADSRSLNLAIGDFSGESIRVGPPTYRVQQRMTSPEVFLNLPPMHRDILDGVGEEIIINTAYTATLISGNSVIAESSSQSINEWSLSVGMETSVGGVAGTVEASLENTYGENFSETTTEINSIKFVDKTTAKDYDQVIYNGTNYAVWEYPILGVETDPPDEPTTIAVVFPLVDTTTAPTTAQGRTCDENFYTPSHQPYNVWSYDPMGEVLFKDYDPSRLIGSKQTSGGTEFVISMGTVSETLRTDSFSNQISAGLEYSYENELEIPLVGKAWDFSFRAYANGEYKIEEISTLKSTFTDETTVAIKLPSDPDPSAYQMIAFFYWAKAGYLVLDYQTQPAADGSWLLYNKTDPAFILPWYGFPDPDTGVFPSLPDPDAPHCGMDKQLFTHDIEFNKDYVENGETLSMTATVRNFSNITPPADVLVRFFLGYPASGNQIAACTIAKAQLARIEGPASCDATWEVSGASGEEKIYAVIDPGSAQKPVGAFDEMHDEGDMINNNIGYGLLHVANADYVDPGLRQVQAYQSIIYEEAPGSGYGLYVPTTNFTETIRYELLPIDLGSLSIVGVPIQVQAFRGGQQFPEESHSISPIPAGLMVTYNDTDLLPGMLESNLRLYRLDGSSWVDATCPEHDFYRFANDNLLAVPICQTGIFVLSDQEPVLLQTETFLPFVRK